VSNNCSGLDQPTYRCDPRHTYQPNNNVTQPIGNISILTVLGLSKFLVADTEATQSAWYGKDNIGLGRASKQSVTISDQLVAGTISKVFNLGLFGLSTKVLNLGGSSRQTFLDLLRNATTIPANGFSYTAGSFGKDVMWNLPGQSGFSTQYSTPSGLGGSPKSSAIPPNFVLGGYDISRVELETSLQVDIVDNSALSATYPLYVNLTSITFAGSEKEWHNGTVDSLGSVAIYIDSSVAQLWLPLSACKVFEDVFGLTWDETSQLYLINATHHDHLQQLNTAVTFSLHSSRHNSTVRNFTLSYASFDLIVTYPLVESTSYYFPLKRASSPDQYILGRTFLQETHISVDYGAATFNISKAVFSNTRGKLVSFPNTTFDSSPNTTSDIIPNTTSNTATIHHTGISTAAYASIGTSVGVIAMIVVVSLLAWRKRWWPVKKPPKKSDATGEKAQYVKGELHGEVVCRVEAMGTNRVELEAKGPMHEVDATGDGPHGVRGLNLLCELDAERSPREIGGNRMA
jgi:hypothetical protein